MNETEWLKPVSADSSCRDPVCDEMKEKEQMADFEGQCTGVFLKFIFGAFVQDLEFALRGFS